MENGERGINHRNGLLAVLSAIIIGLLIWSLSEQSNWFESDAANRSRYYARDAERQIADHCTVVPTQDQAKCVDEAVDAAREHQREEQDLAAQKVTAWWTRIMGGAAITGMVLSALGVYLVWATFRETRKQARSAESHLKLGLAQSAPDVDIGIVLIMSAECENTVPQHLHIDAVNSGYTEAKEFKFKHVLVSTSDGKINDLPLRQQAGRDAIVDIPHNRSMHGYDLTNDNFVFDIAEIKSAALAGMTITARIAYSYKDMFGDTTTVEGVWRGVLEAQRSAAEGNPVECVRTNLARTE